MVAKQRFISFLRPWTLLLLPLWALGLMVVYGLPWLPLDLVAPLQPALESLLPYQPGLYGLPGVWLGGVAGWLVLFLGRQAWLNRAMRHYVRLVLPRVDANLTQAQATQFWNQLSDLIPKHHHVCFGLSGGTEGVTFSCAATSEARSRALITQAMADWPGTQSQLAIETADPLPWSGAKTSPKAAFTIILRPKKANAPIQISVEDPLTAPLIELSRLPGGVRAGILVAVRPDPFTRRTLGAEVVKGMTQGQQGQDQTIVQKRALVAADKRVQHIFLESEVRVWAAAGSLKMARSVARSLAQSLMAQYAASNPLVKAKEVKGFPSYSFPLFAGQPWTDAELATLAHLKGKDGKAVAPQLKTAPAQPLPPSSLCVVPPAARTFRHLTLNKPLEVIND